LEAAPVQQIQVALQRRHAVALLQRDQRFSSGTGAGGDNMIFMIKNRLIFPYVSTHTHTHTHTHTPFTTSAGEDNGIDHNKN
jgi:hypothetical protein